MTHLHWRRTRTALTTLFSIVVLAACGGGNSKPADAGAAQPTPTVACTITNAELGPHKLPPKLPDHLVWVGNDTDAEFADPNAQRGGTFRTFMLSFPATLRLVGPDSNGGFAGYMRANQLGLTARHPNSLKPIPELATQWAFGADGRSIYFHLDPSARWSDGKPVTADDYLFTMKLMRSKFIVDPWYNDYYTKDLMDVVKYDEHTIGVYGVAPRPADEMLDEYALRPTPCHAHKLDANWMRDYNWLIEPVTGPYVIDRMEKGKYVEFKRIANWWGNDKRYLRHRFNPDRVRISVIRDQDTAFRFFLNGELDTFPLTLPDFWYNKAVGAPFDNGWIDKITYYVSKPSGGTGIWLNMDDPLLRDRNVRLGLNYAMNFDRVIKTVLRNDYVRATQHFEDYPEYSNPDLHALPFDLAAADKALNAAGFDKRGPDGIRTRGAQRLAVELAYSNPSSRDRLTVLAQAARQAGVDLVLREFDDTAFFKTVREKKFQAAWVSWQSGFVPAFWEYYHSVNASKPQTNNILNYADAQTDAWIDRFRASADKAERVQLAHRIEQRTQDSMALIPGVRVPFVRAGYWRYIKLPASNGTRTTSDLFDPFDDSVFWIDAKEQQIVTAARKQGTHMKPSRITDTTWQQAPAAQPQH